MARKQMLAVISALLLSQASSAQVFQVYDLIVSNPAGVVAAMNKFVESPVGKQSTAAVYLNQYIANGADQATHQILVVHPSPQDMDANLARNAVAPGWAKFMSEMSQVSQIESEGVGQILAVGGDLSSPLLTNPNRASIYYQLSVTDPAVYASAWSDFTEANADRGIVSYLSSITAFGSHPATHVVSNQFNSPGEAITNSPQSYSGWDTFLQRTGNIRTIEGIAMTQGLVAWLPE
jgi:choline dehydrogenase-like flavoprotein